MVHQFGDEKRLGGVFLDLFAVLRVVAQGALRGLPQTASRKKADEEKNAGNAALHDRNLNDGDCKAGNYNVARETQIAISNWQLLAI
jgi:hypothetical protein